MLNVATLSVRVVDFCRDPVSGARVSLISQSKGAKPINLDWNEKANLYAVELNTRGTFTLTVSAKGFDDQEREINLPHPATVEEFVLGIKGMPFYYRGRVKTPFEPKPDLVGVTIAPGTKDGEAKIINLANRLKLSQVKTGEQIRNNNVLILQHNADASDEQRQNALDTLLRDDVVQLAGPVVELFEERAVYLTSQLLVKFRSRVTPKLAEDYGRRHNLRMMRAVRYIGNAYLFEAQPKADYSLLQTAAALAELDDVEYAEPNSVTTTMLYAINPADFLVSQQWHIPLINLPDAWQVLQDGNAEGVTQGQPGDLTYGDENLMIAVFDSGIQSSTTPGGVTTASHPDFSGTVTGGAPKVAAFYDFRNMVANNDAALWNNHGMGCAGVAAAQADNAASVAGEVEGVAGAAGNCQVIGMIVPFGQTNQRWADALVWMAGFNPGWIADGISYPIGTVFPVPPVPGASIHTNSTRIPDVGLLDDTLDYLAANGRGGKGVISFLAAGNTAANISHWNNNTIADHDKVITVAASINTDVRSGYSCFDPAIDICAPSSGDAAQTVAGAPGKVTTDIVGGGNLAGHTGAPLSYRDNFGGTSSATPLVAGVGALMLSINPQLSWVQVRELLINTAVKIDAANVDPVGQWITDGSGNPLFSQWYGYGRVDAYKAVKAAAMSQKAIADMTINIHWTRHRHMVAVLQAERKSLVPLLRQTSLDRIDVGIYPTGIAFDGTHVWVANTGSGYLSKINISTNNVVANVPVGSQPYGLVFDGAHIWVSNSGERRVSKIDVATNIVVETIRVGRAPRGLAFDGSRIWVANKDSNSISIINIALNMVEAAIRFDDAYINGPEELAFDGTHIWVSHEPKRLDFHLIVSRIDFVSNSITNVSIPYPQYPHGVYQPYQLAFDGSHIWVTEYHHNHLHKIDTKTSSIAETVDVGRGPYGIVFDGTHIWVSNKDNHNVSKIDVDTDEVIKTVGVGRYPTGMVFDGTHVWVAKHGFTHIYGVTHNICKIPAFPLGTELPSSHIST
ncbi:MAG: S8 family serine peptidase [Planctomycetota bacterium]